MPTITNDLRIDSLLAGNEYRWNAGKPFGTAVELTFSFPVAVPAYASEEDANGFSGFTTEQKAATRQIIARIAAEIGLTFTEVADTAANYGVLRFANNKQGEVSSGYAQVPFGAADDSSGDVYINNEQPENLSNITPGSNAWATLVHEIGHALGLKHPGNYNAGEAGADAAEPPFLPATEDSVLYTIMSYNYTPDEQERDWWGIYDLLALQHLYGKKPVATGNNTYTYNDNSGTVLLVINDSGGIDTVDVAAVTGGVTLSLVPGSFSSVGKTATGKAASNNLSIAFDVIIEHVIGSAGNDTITGNSANNQLRGNGGNDSINGGGGIDTALFSGLRAGYSINVGSNGALSVQGADGNDSLSSIERLRFQDTSLAYDLAGNAGTVAKILGAVFGPAALAIKDYVGIGLQYTDGGMGQSELMTLALGARLGSNPSNAAVVDLLYSNLFGVLPPAADQANFVGLIQNGTYTQASLGLTAADLGQNLTNIGLVGLASTGLEFV